MFDMGWSELLLVAVLAIIFVGPKDLPRLMRTLGQYAAKMRSMAREFQNSFEDLARETELDELRKEVASLRDIAAKPLGDIEHAINMDQAMKAAQTPPVPEALPANESSANESSANLTAQSEPLSESKDPAGPDKGTSA